MPFSKGVSGNIRGRPKMTTEEKEQKEVFTELLKGSTVNALQNIIAIANDRRSKDCFNACKYIISKAYGADMVFFENEDNTLTINIVSHTGSNKEDSWANDEW